MTNLKFGLIAFVATFGIVGAMLSPSSSSSAPTHVAAASTVDKCEPLLDRYIALNRVEDARADDAHIAWKVCKGGEHLDARFGKGWDK